MNVTLYTIDLKIYSQLASVDSFALCACVCVCVCVCVCECECVSVCLCLCLCVSVLFFLNKKYFLWYTFKYAVSDKKIFTLPISGKKTTFFFGLISTNELVRHTLNFYFELSEHTINHLSFSTSKVINSVIFNWGSQKTYLEFPLTHNT